MSSRLYKLWQKLSNKEYRDAFVASHASSNIANQIATLREDRRWTQKDLAERAGMKQSRISVLENPSNESANIATLVRIAHAFDVGLAIRFVPISNVARWAVEADSDSLGVASFDDDKISNGRPVYSTMIHTPNQLLPPTIVNATSEQVSIKFRSSTSQLYQVTGHA